MDHGSKQKAVRGVAWTSAANWGCQFLSFFIYAALARLLSPHTFGLIALASVYIAFIQIFVTQGFGMAIIQRRNLEEEHLDSAFWIAMATAVVLCCMSLLLASPIAYFFKEPGIAPVICWLSFSMLFNALCSIQSAILTREMNFRPLAIRSIAATAVGGMVGITMAFLGFGVWSLVGQQLTSSVLGCICLWFAVPWRPRLLISRSHLRDLYGFSLSVAGNDVLWFFSQRSDQTMVGYGFGALGLGPYSLASKVTSVAYDAVVGPLLTVAFPAFSKLQSEPAAFEKALHKFCEMSSFVCLPLFVGLAAVSPDLVPLLFGAKWIAAVPILQVLSFYGAVRVILAFVNPFMLSKGRAGLYLLLNIALSALTLIGCLVAVRLSPEAIAFSMVASLVAFFAIFLVVARSYLELRALPLLRSFVFPSLCSLLVLITIDFTRSFVAGKTAPAAALAIWITVGALVYISAAYLLRRNLVRAMFSMVRSSMIPSRLRRGTAPTSIEDVAEEIAVASTEA